MSATTRVSTIATAHLLAGPGLVQRSGNTVVAVDGTSGDGGFTADVLRDSRELSGPDLIRQLASRVLNLAPGAGSRLGVVTTTVNGALAFLHGEIELRTENDVVSAATLVTGIEIALDGVAPVSVVPSAAASDSDERTDLTAGVVAASGFHLDFAGFPPPPAASLATSVDDSVTVERVLDAISDPDVGGSRPTGPAPTVRLLPAQVEQSGDGPQSEVAPHRTLRPVNGSRPQLGVLVVDDGTTIPVARDLVLGREPHQHEFVVRDGALAVAVSDPTQTVSREHAHLTLEECDVHVADLGSANGTFVRPGPDTGWVEVVGANRIRLGAGAVIRLGDRELVFESDELIEEAS